MASLKEIAETVHAVLRRELDPAVGAQRLGVDPARLGIYRGFVYDHVAGVLAKLYPYVRAHLGAELWAPLVAAYFREVPAASWELNACGRPFPAWLDARLGAGAAPGVDAFHVALAQFEWEQFAVYMHQAVVPDPAILAAPALNPTLTLLQLPYPVVRFVVDHPDAAALTPAAPIPAPEPQIALLFRRYGSWRVAYYQASDDLLFALKVVYEQIPLALAADAAHQPLAVARQAIDHAIAVGLVLAAPEAV